MTYSRGDVVLVNYLHADLRKVSFRPAIVVQSDALSTNLSQKILVKITSKKREGPARVAVALDSPVARQMGLMTDSVIMTDSIMTTEIREINRKIGTCPIMDHVSKALAIALDIPTR